MLYEFYQKVKRGWAVFRQEPMSLQIIAGVFVLLVVGVVLL